MMETLLTLALAAVPVWVMWRDKERRHARLRKELEALLSDREWRLKTIDAELRKAHAQVRNALGPLRDMPPRGREHMALDDALGALHEAGELASGQRHWPHQPYDPSFWTRGRTSE